MKGVNMRITRAPGGMLTYHYTAGGCMSFQLHTLAEVGAPYQAAARRQLAARYSGVEFGRYIDARPWVADFAKGRIKI